MTTEPRREDLIYDWNVQDPPPRPSHRATFDDESLRDGLQSPSVRTPSVSEKIEILHRIASLGIDSVNLGLPGAGAHAVRDVEALAREIVRTGMKIDPNCAARTLEADIRPIAEIQQRTGLSLESAVFLGSSQTSVSTTSSWTRRWTSSRPSSAGSRSSATSRPGRSTG